jgi:hypothetical protein
LAKDTQLEKHGAIVTFSLIVQVGIVEHCCQILCSVASVGIYDKYLVSLKSNQREIFQRTLIFILE